MPSGRALTADVETLAIAMVSNTALRSAAPISADWANREGGSFWDLGGAMAAAARRLPAAASPWCRRLRGIKPTPASTRANAGRSRREAGGDQRVQADFRPLRRA